ACQALPASDNRSSNEIRAVTMTPNNFHKIRVNLTGQVFKPIARRSQIRNSLIEFCDMRNATECYCYDIRDIAIHVYSFVCKLQNSHVMINEIKLEVPPKYKHIKLVEKCTFPSIVCLVVLYGHPRSQNRRLRSTNLVLSGKTLQHNAELIVNLNMLRKSLRTTTLPNNALMMSPRLVMKHLQSNCPGLLTLETLVTSSKIVTQKGLTIFETEKRSFSCSTVLVPNCHVIQRKHEG
ncbi:hypothetical protein CLF_113603, partial [Clonorchis sinensis]